MFEIGQGRFSRLEAQPAILPASAHDLSTADQTSPRKPKNARRRRVRLILAALGLGLTIGAVEEAVRLSHGAPELERIARFMGFGIDQVTLEGHRFSFDRDIFDALDLANVRTFAALDTAAVKARIERLPWVDTAELTRAFPGSLEVRVTERKPYAVWSRTDRLYLIDKTGRVLAAVSGGELPNLPRIAGEGAASEAAGLMETVARYPEIASRLAEAERVSERRWTLRLANATTLVLPADNEVGALEALSRDAALLRLVEGGNATLDFRGPGRVAIRRAAGTGQPAAQPSTGS